MRVLVTGGRGYRDDGRLATALEFQLNMFADGMIVIEGGAKGADAAARDWCRMHAVHCATVPALWQLLGKKAGPRRNTAMLILQPDLVVACPGGTGTANMVAQARAAGIAVEDLNFSM